MVALWRGWSLELPILLFSVAVMLSSFAFSRLFKLVTCFLSNYFLSWIVLLKTSAEKLHIFPWGIISLEYIPRWGISRPKQRTAAQLLLNITRYSKGLAQLTIPPTPPIFLFFSPICWQRSYFLFFSIYSLLSNTCWMPLSAISKHISSKWAFSFFNEKSLESSSHLRSHSQRQMRVHWPEHSYSLYEPCGSHTGWRPVSGMKKYADPN